MLVDTLGHLLALYLTPINEQGRARVAKRVEAVQGTVNQSVRVSEQGCPCFLFEHRTQLNVLTSSRWHTH